MRRSRLTAILAAVAALFARAANDEHVITPHFIADDPSSASDSLEADVIVIDGDTLHTSFIPPPPVPKHTGPLTDEDFYEIAEDLDVEPAAIRAIVEIETGKTHSGFHADSLPVINFDLPVFRRTAARRKINLSKYAKSHPEVFRAPNIRNYGSQQAAQQARLDAAMTIDSIAAIESTFWGMFQIGGFNWKLCGTESREEFLRLMKRSEYDQLKLFANYIRNTGLLKYLKAKNWAAFSKIYNGPGYAARGYHTRMAAAYRRYRETMKPRTKPE